MNSFQNFKKIRICREIINGEGIISSKSRLSKEGSVVDVDKKMEKILYKTINCRFMELEENLKQEIIKTIKFLVDPIVGDVEVEFQKEGDQWRINIKTKKSQKLKGSRGEVLNSLQHIVRVIVHRKFPNDRTHFLLDVNLFRQRRESYITEEIPELAKNQVLKEGITIFFNNLSSYERKMIHKSLCEVDGLETTSVGERYNRRLIIRPTSNTGSGGMEKSKVLDINKIVVDE